MDTVLRHGGGAWLAKQSAARLVDLMDRALDREVHSFIFLCCF
jgi:hypothetical protein